MKRGFRCQIEARGFGWTSNKIRVSRLECRSKLRRLGLFISYYFNEDSLLLAWEKVRGCCFKSLC